MYITVFHKVSSGYSVKVYPAAVRRKDGISFVGGGIESENEAVVRIYTKKELGISPYDKVVFEKSTAKNPPDTAFIIKRVSDNRRGILSHIRLDCVC